MICTLCPFFYGSAIPGVLYHNAFFYARFESSINHNLPIHMVTATDGEAKKS